MPKDQAPSQDSTVEDMKTEEASATTAPAAPASTDTDESQTDWRDRELKKVRQEAANYRIKFNDFKKQVEETMISKTELDKQLAEKDAEIAQVQLEVTRQAVARQYRIPDDLVDMLNGTDKDEFENAAKKLAGHLGHSSTAPTPNSGGGFGDTEMSNLDELSPEQLAAKYAPRTGF